MGMANHPENKERRYLSRNTAPRPNPLISGFHCRGTLPHLKREGGTYFVCFREAGSLPSEVVRRLKSERESLLHEAYVAKRPLTWHEQKQVFAWYSERVDRHLDAGHGGCHMRHPEFATIMAYAIRFFEGQRYEVKAWVVMPNHVHAVVWPMPSHSLSEILHSWKSYTSHEFNKRLANKVVPFWQAESFEHLIRDDEDLHRCCAYTLMNPVNAGLCGEPQQWRWSSGYVEQR